LLSSALAVLDPHLARNPGDRAALLSAVGARLRLAALSPDTDEAALRAALAACDAPKSGQSDPRLQALRVESLLRLRDERGAALAGRLWRDGYMDASFARLLREHGLATGAEPLAANDSPAGKR
jgi:hypothetical protein